MCFKPHPVRASIKFYFNFTLLMDRSPGFGSTPVNCLLSRYNLCKASHNCYRDAKQFTGLTDCQSRNKNALQNAFNFSLTAINVAKLQMHRNGWTYSISRYKLLMASIFLVQRFSSRCAPEHYPKIIQDVYNEFKWIAA